MHERAALRHRQRCDRSAVPRGTGWAADFNPVIATTWPVAQWIDGFLLFDSLFADDAVLDYDTLCMQIEADLPYTTIDFVGLGDPECPILGYNVLGSLDYFYYGITLGPQLSSTTEITPTTIDIVGDTATTVDSYVHTAVFNHYLVGDEEPPEVQTGNHYGDWARTQKWVWRDSQWKSGWEITHWYGVVNEL